MADQAPGVIVRTEDGAVGHPEATDWKTDGDNNLDIYKGDDTVATYRNGFWYYVGMKDAQTSA